MSVFYKIDTKLRTPYLNNLQLSAFTLQFIYDFIRYIFPLVYNFVLFFYTEKLYLLQFFFYNIYFSNVIVN